MNKLRIALAIFTLTITGLILSPQVAKVYAQDSSKETEQNIQQSREQRQQEINQIRERNIETRQQNSEETISNDDEGESTSFNIADYRELYNEIDQISNTIQTEVSDLDIENSFADFAL